MKRAFTIPASHDDSSPTARPTLIVFSHLRWGFIFQRPQHLLSRLARHYDVLFVEEPVHAEEPARLDVQVVAKHVEVLTPRTPLESSGFAEDQLRAVKPLLDQFLKERGVDDLLAWFYTPAALPLVAGYNPRAVVYDAMDDMCAPGAPEAMLQSEAALLKVTDLVLTSGPSLYEVKRQLHHHVQCLPSAVDAAHFSPPMHRTHPQDAREVDALQDYIREPRLGFFGVIDERVDLQLVAAVADADPTWQVVMVGPVLKVDPARLPRRPNIHWLGMQPYSHLPRIVSAWDVCLMPFAINDRTRYISPTKTLEYMAAEKPVVSSALPDVVSLYGDVVRVSPTRHGFVDQCREALGETGRLRAQRAMEMTQCVARFSWDQSAESVHRLIEECLSSKIMGPRLVTKRAASSQVPVGQADRARSAIRPGGAPSSSLAGFSLAR